MKFNTLLLLGGVGFVLHGCTSMNALTSDSFKQYASPQEVIDKKNLTDNHTATKEYVYDWGLKQTGKEVQSLIPKQYLSQFCAAKAGKFSQVHKSSMSLVKDIWAKKLLATYSSVKQGIGTYHCRQGDGQDWYVSIEPISERKLDQADTRVVSLQTKILTLDEIKKMYLKSAKTTVLAEKKGATTPTTKNNTVTKTAQTKAVEEKKVTAPVVEEEKEKPQPEKVVVVSPQSQQMQLYTSARKDLGRGQNQINACNSAERAYNFGRLRGSSGINVYAESGILVAKCLTTVPSYSRRFSNPEDRAKRILQNLANNQNHAVAKYMLKQMK